MDNVALLPKFSGVKSLRLECIWSSSPHNKLFFDGEIRVRFDRASTGKRKGSPDDIAISMNVE